MYINAWKKGFCIAFYQFEFGTRLQNTSVQRHEER